MERSAGSYKLPYNRPRRRYCRRHTPLRSRPVFHRHNAAVRNSGGRLHSETLSWHHLHHRSRTPPVRNHHRIPAERSNDSCCHSRRPHYHFRHHTAHRVQTGAYRLRSKLRYRRHRYHTFHCHRLCRLRSTSFPSCRVKYSRLHHECYHRHTLRQLAEYCHHSMGAS